MRMLTLVTMLLTTAMLAGCTVPTVAAGNDRLSPTPTEALAADYKLGISDKVRITVYNEDSMSGEFQVNASGMVSLPLIGDVAATGETTAELAATVEKDLAAGYLRDPHVSAEVTAYRPYFILGEVKSPAQYPYVNGMTVMNAVATAGGFTPRAAEKKIYIRRSGQDEEKVYDVTPDLRVLPGDTIRVGERYF